MKGKIKTSTQRSIAALGGLGIGMVLGTSVQSSFAVGFGIGLIILTAVLFAIMSKNL